MPRTGRPSKRDAETEGRIIEAVRAGNYLETAARYGGIAPQTLHDWRNKHPDFSDALEKARAEAETRNVTIIQQAARVSWQAAAWWLERSFPARYSRRDRMAVEHSGTVTQEVVDAVDAEIGRLAAQLAGTVLTSA